MTNQAPDPKKVKELISVNFDARRYFYTKADEKWFDWLVSNGFLDVVKQKAEDPTRYSYQTPELDYVSNMAEKIPEKVVSFILTVPISKENFNPEVVDRFLWTASKLSATHLARLVPKIRDEQWIRLMAPFNRWGFEYQKMIEALIGAKDYESLVTLAEAILVVRSGDEIKRSPYGGTSDLFFVSDLHQTEIFNKLIEVDDVHLEAAFMVACNALANVIRIGEKEDDVFEIGETFHLFDVDFFNLEVGAGRFNSERDDVRDLAAVVKIFSERTIGNQCDDSENVKAIYKKYIDPLPDSRSVWRLRLYIWSLCPEMFKEELKTAFFRGLESRETLWPITGGAEYDHALKKCFYALSKSDREAYIARAFELLEVQEEHPYGYGIFASIQEFLNEDEKKRVEALYKIPLDPKYSPEPSVRRSYGGTVVPQAPENSEEIWASSVPKIVEILKTEWTPEKLHQLDGKRDFLRPINAEGVADKMRSQIKERTKEYTDNAILFFDRNRLDPHYTYSFFRGLDEMARLNQEQIKEVNWDQIIELGVAIVAEGEREAFDFSKREREHFDAWLSGWTTAHDGLADVIQQYLRNENGVSHEHFLKNRDKVFAIIRYLLTVPDPRPEDEQPETAKSKTSAAGGEMLVSDPHSMAINSARGRAYEALVLFIERDGRKFLKEAKTKIEDDVLAVYKDLLARENTAAIMFLYGYYFPFFNYRAVDQVRALLNQIFTEDPTKKHLYLAAWEGYLARSLYKEVFDELREQYKRAIQTDSNIYPKRNYRVELDEGLATHIALAYVHFEEFTLESELFREFWNMPNKKRHKEFAAFIGRYVISRNQPKDFLNEHKEIDLNKLLKFWDWLLDNCSDPDVFAEMGFWMDVTGEVYPDIAALAIRIKKTLEKSNGRVDWEIKLMDSLSTLAAVAPKETVEILRLYFTPLDMSPRNCHFTHVDKDLVEVFRTLYKNPETKQATHQLIDQLLPIGNGAYWSLEAVLK